VAQCQKPRRAHQQGGADARGNLQAISAMAGNSRASIDPADADPEKKSQSMPEYVHVRAARAQQGQ
jgi:hypothetical protein